MGAPDDSGREDGTVLELCGLGVHFGATQAVKDVTHSVQRGEWLGLIGANGSGKTTLLRAIAGLVGYQGGIRIEGRSTGHLSRRHRAQLVAYVPQNPALPLDMAALDYVALGRTPHLGYFGSEGPADRYRCIDLLDRLGLAAMGQRHLRTLSGGEIQRLLLARALAQEAPILLLDEPTSALDLGTRIEALELVDELRAEHHLTVLSALHDLTLAAQFADRLVLLSAGAIAAAGRPADVLEEHRLGEHFGTRVQVIRTLNDELVVVPRRAPAPKGSHAQHAS